MSEWLVFAGVDDPDRLDCGKEWAIINADTATAAVDQVYGGELGDKGAIFLVIPAPRKKGVLVRLELAAKEVDRVPLADTNPGAA